VAGRQNAVIEFVGRLDFCCPWVSSILGFASLPLTPSPAHGSRGVMLQWVPRLGPGWTSKAGGDGAGCRENLRCLKPEADKILRCRRA
jgi:hypothetical protein